MADVYEYEDNDELEVEEDDYVIMNMMTAAERELIVVPPLAVDVLVLNFERVLEMPFGGAGRAVMALKLKAHESIVQIFFRDGPLREMLDGLAADENTDEFRLGRERLLKLLRNHGVLVDSIAPGDVMNADGEPAVERILVRSSAAVATFMATARAPLLWHLSAHLHSTTLRALGARARAVNDRLFINTQLSLARLHVARCDWAASLATLEELEPLTGNDIRRAEIIALQMESLAGLPDAPKLAAAYPCALDLLRSAAPPPSVTGAIFEAGGKLHMMKRDWPSARTDFYSAFAAFDAAGAQERAVACLRFVRLADMLALSPLEDRRDMRALNDLERAIEVYEGEPFFVAFAELAAANLEGDLDAVERILGAAQRSNLAARAGGRGEEWRNAERVLERILDPLLRVGNVGGVGDAGGGGVGDAGGGSGAPPVVRRDFIAEYIGVAGGGGGGGGAAARVAAPALVLDDYTLQYIGELRASQLLTFEEQLVYARDGIAQRESWSDLLLLLDSLDAALAPPAGARDIAGPEAISRRRGARLEIVALQMEMFAELPDAEPKLRAAYGRALDMLRAAEPPLLRSLVTGVIHEAGGKLGMMTREWGSAREAFYLAFTAFQGAGGEEERALTCLRCTLLAGMRALSESRRARREQVRFDAGAYAAVLPLPPAEAMIVPFKDDASIAALSKLEAAVRRDELSAYEPIRFSKERLEIGGAGVLVVDDFLRPRLRHIHELMNEIRDEDQRKLVSAAAMNSFTDLERLAALPGIADDIFVGALESAMKRPAGGPAAVATMRILFSRLQNAGRALRGDGDTFLTRAAKDSNFEALSAFLACETVDVNVKNAHGHTALHCAAFKHSEESIAALLSHPNIDVNLKASSGDTALVAAAYFRERSPPVVQLLVSHPATDFGLIQMHLPPLIKRGVFSARTILENVATVATARRRSALLAWWRTLPTAFRR